MRNTKSVTVYKSQTPFAVTMTYAASFRWEDVTVPFEKVIMVW